jgi:hypothetical protein
MRPSHIKQVRFPLSHRTPSSRPKRWLKTFREELGAWLSVLTIVAAGLFGLVKYLDQQHEAELARITQAKTAEENRVAQAERENMTRLIESQRPFLDQQFKTYLRTNALVGRMVVLRPADPEFLKLVEEFESLYWSELALVEDRGVAQAMSELGKKIHQVAGSAIHSPGYFNAEAIELAHAFRDSIRKNWEQGLASK